MRGNPVEVSRANPTVVSMRSQQLDDMLNIVSVGRGPISGTVKAALKTVMPSELRSQAIRFTQRHLVQGRLQPPDERLLLELRRRFRGEVVALSEYLNRDLVALWGYDRLG